jgi:serine/threonine protein kinase
VLVDAEGVAPLTDFGLTRSLREAGRLERALRGTVDYIAPEQIEGAEVGGRADQYSLACHLYECLVGEPPFRRDSDAATVFAHLAHDPPGPRGLEDVFRRALAKLPDDRFASFTELVDAARRRLAKRPSRRWPLAATGTALALVALLGAAADADGAAPSPSQARVYAGQSQLE